MLALIARGKGDVAIASELGVSVSTVRTYLTRLYRDNGLANRAEAVAAWAAAGDAQFDGTAHAASRTTNGSRTLFIE